MTMFPRRETSHPLWTQSSPQSKVLPYIQTDHPLFQLVPIASGLLTGHNEKSLAPSSFATPLQVFVHIDEILPEPFLLQAAQFLCSAFYHMKKVLDPSLALWPFTGLAPVAPSPLFWEVLNWTLCSRCGPTSAE